MGLGGTARPLEWFIGATDVVHGTNFLVPPTSRAAAVVSVHDLTPLHHPELCNEATLAYPGLIRRAVGRGAWVHTDSAFVAGEVREAFGADPSRVRVVNPGIPVLPVPAEAEAEAVLRRLLPAGLRRFCLSIGTAEPRKDLPGLVRAFDAVADRSARCGPRPGRTARMGRAGACEPPSTPRRPGTGSCERAG